MDSREQPPPPPHQPPQQHSMLLGHHHHHQLLQQHHHHQQQQQQHPHPHSHHHQTAPSSYPTMINPNMSPTSFPFNSVAPRPQSKPPTPSDGAFDGSSPPSSAGMLFSIEPAKKKRGRPRKYASDGNIALGLSPTPISSGTSAGHADSGGSGTPVPGSEPSSKRHRGRPPGSGKKQLDALGGVGGVGFTPHVLTVKAGEDIASKIMAFSQQGPRTVCILSANGAICNVTLRQPAMSGGTVTYEGRFEIISLSGSFPLTDNNGNQGRPGFSVSMAGSDGRVVGGGVAGVLMAASSVQVIVGSFIADGKKSSSSASKSAPSSSPQTQMLNFGGPMMPASPLSQGDGSESSNENGDGDGDESPINQNPGMYGNSGQPIHSMQMYQIWGQNQQ